MQDDCFELILEEKTHFFTCFKKGKNSMIVWKLKVLQHNSVNQVFVSENAHYQLLLITTIIYLITMKNECTLKELQKRLLGTISCFERNYKLQTKLP